MEIKLNENAETLMKILNDSGFQGYAVGGCVRDSIMGKEPFDFDITTNASTDEMQKLFSGYRCLKQGLKHGTVAVIINGEVIECTTYRIDGEYSDGRHPDKVTFSSKLGDDLSRRDFTINALAYNKSDGIIDLFGGIEDIKSEVIRAIGDPDRRFTEDGLRIMRAMRFSSTLGFKIEKNTAESIKRNAPRLSLISRERISQEFEKMLVGKNIKYVLENFSDILKKAVCDFDIREETFANVEKCPTDFAVRLYALIKDSDKAAENLANCGLTIRKSDRKTVNRLLQMSRPETKSDIKRLMNRFDVPAVKKYLEFLDDCTLLSLFSEIVENDECFCVNQLKIHGEKLEELGFHGKSIQKIKEKLLNDIIDGKVNNSEEEILRYLEG